MKIELEKRKGDFNEYAEIVVRKRDPQKGAYVSKGGDYEVRAEIKTGDSGSYTVTLNNDGSIIGLLGLFVKIPEQKIEPGDDRALKEYLSRNIELEVYKSKGKTIMYFPSKTTPIPDVSFEDLLKDARGMKLAKEIKAERSLDL